MHDKLRHIATDSPVWKYEQFDGRTGALTHTKKRIAIEAQNEYHDVWHVSVSIWNEQRGMMDLLSANHAVSLPEDEAIETLKGWISDVENAVITV